MRTLWILAVMVLLFESFTAADGEKREMWKGDSETFQVRFLLGLKHSPHSWFLRGESVSTTVLFFGCKPDAEGLFNINSEFTVFGPKGEIPALQQSKSRAWDPNQPHDGPLQIGYTVVLPEGTPLGRYKVVALARDAIANAAVSVTQTFELVDTPAE